MFLPIEQARKDFKINPASVFFYILAASYLYYIRYHSIFEDHEFDKMCKYALDNYDSLNHIHKHLVTTDMLKAGSCYNLSVDDYPNGVVRLAEDLMRKQIESVNQNTKAYQNRE